MILRSQESDASSPAAVHAKMAAAAIAVGAPPPGPGWGDLLPLARLPLASRSLNPCGQEKTGQFANGNTCAASPGGAGEDRRGDRRAPSAKEVAERLAAGEKPSAILAASGWRGNAAILDSTYAKAVASPSPLESEMLQSPEAIAYAKRAAAGAIAGVAKAAIDMEGTRDVTIMFLTPEQHLENEIHEWTAAEIKKLQKFIADAGSRFTPGTIEFDAVAGESERTLAALRDGTYFTPARREAFAERTSNSYAYYQTGRGDLTFVSGQLADDRGAEMSYAALDYAGSSSEHFGYHEMVHVAHWRAARKIAGVAESGPLNDADHDLVRKTMDTLAAAATENLYEAISRRTKRDPKSFDGKLAARRIITRSVSEYANTNARELVAEYVAGLALGAIDRDRDLDAFLADVRAPRVVRQWPVSPKAAELKRERDAYVANIAAGDLPADQAMSSRALNPCGQEKTGQFAVGNTCAAGEDGAGAAAVAESGSDEQPSWGDPAFAAISAANCPEPCGMLAQIGPVAGSGAERALLIPEHPRSKDGKFSDVYINGVNWEEAEAVADGLSQSFHNALGEYTDGGFRGMNADSRRGDEESLDRRWGAGSTPVTGSPEEIIERYGPDDWVGIESPGDLLELLNGQEYLDQFDSLMEKAKKSHDTLVRNAIGRDGPDFRPWKPAPGREGFDPGLVYSAVSTKPGVSPAEMEYIPGARPSDIQALNDIAEEIRDLRAKQNVKNEKELVARLNALVAEATGGAANTFSRDKTYVSHEEMVFEAYRAARESGEFRQEGVTLAEFDAGLREIAEAANKKGPIATWRSAGNRSTPLADSLSVGDIFTGQGFLSTSASPVYAAEWKGRDLEVLFRIVGRGGAPIMRMSRMPEEFEVLYPNSAQFRVAAVTKDVTLLGQKMIDGSYGFKRDGVTVVDLVEIEE